MYISSDSGVSGASSVSKPSAAHAVPYTASYIATYTAPYTTQHNTTIANATNTKPRTSTYPTTTYFPATKLPTATNPHTDTPYHASPYNTHTTTHNTTQPTTHTTTHPTTHSTYPFTIPTTATPCFSDSGSSNNDNSDVSAGDVMNMGMHLPSSDACDYSSGGDSGECTDRMKLNVGGTGGSGIKADTSGADSGGVYAQDLRNVRSVDNLQSGTGVDGTTSVQSGTSSGANITPYQGARPYTNTAGATTVPATTTSKNTKQYTTTNTTLNNTEIKTTTTTTTTNPPTMRQQQERRQGEEAALVSSYFTCFCEHEQDKEVQDTEVQDQEVQDKDVQDKGEGRVKQGGGRGSDRDRGRYVTGLYIFFLLLVLGVSARF